MKALLFAAGLAAACAFSAQAATPEEALYHWGECAVAGGAYQAAVERGTANTTIGDVAERFDALAPRMEKHANAIADSLGEAKSNEVAERLRNNAVATLEAWDEAGEIDDFLVRTFGPTLDRCLKEAADLPEP